MNAKMRRRTRREHPYTMTMIVSNERYYEFDNSVDDAVKWCKKNCKDSFFTNKNFYDRAVFKFANDKDAVIFGLKFL
jgi:hypothetical protein